MRAVEDSSALPRLLGAAAFVLAVCLLGACWLTSSFDGLTGPDGGGSGDGRLEDSGSDSASQDGGAHPDHVDAGTSDTNPVPDAHADSSADAGHDSGVDSGLESGTDGSLYRATVLSDTPLAYWRLGEGSGTVAHDEVPTNPNATYTPVAMLGQTGALFNDPNTAVSLDGDAGCVDTHLTMSLTFKGTDPISIEAWVNPSISVDAQFRHIYEQEISDTSGKEGYGLFIEGSVLSFQRRVHNGKVTVNVTPPTPGVYTHVVATYDGTTMHVYLNGVEPSGTSLTTAASMPTITGLAYVGCMAGSGFLGTLDEVAVYAHALTPSRVLAHFMVGNVGHL